MNIALAETVRSTPLPPVRLPLDEGPHRAALEWWHFMIHAGSRSLVISFLKGGRGLVSGSCALVMRIDHVAGTHRVTSRVRPTRRGLANESGIDLQVGDVSAKGALGVYRISAPGIALALKQDSPVALFGDRGVMAYPGDVELGYYAYTQLAVTGTVDGERIDGTGWMEHQWGDARVSDYTWRYVAAQLDNGERIAAFSIRHDTTGDTRCYGIRIARDGSTRELAAVGLVGVGNVGFHVRARGVGLVIEPKFADQRVRTWIPGLPSFWEGACGVRGTIDGRSVTGTAIGEVVS